MKYILWMVFSYLQICVCFVIPSTKLSSSFSLFNPSKSLTLSKRVLHMTTDALVVGYAGGIAETISLRLKEFGIKTSVALDRNPFSPNLLESAENNEIGVYVGDITTSLRKINGPLQPIPFNSLLSGKYVIICGDDGDETLRGSTTGSATGAIIDKSSKSPSNTLIENVVQGLVPSVKAIAVTNSVISDSNNQGIGKLLGSKSFTESLRDWCQKNMIPISIVKYGKLVGGIKGMESLPFVGLPLLEPELHPSYVLRSVVLADLSSNMYADTELCTRDSISEVLARIVSRNEIGIQALVVSIVGSIPTEKEWERLFSRVTNRGEAELIRIDFGAIAKPDGFLQWIVDSWFPQALIDADAATILTGPRPVRAVKTSSVSMEIRWDDIASDLSIKPAGGLEIRLVPSVESGKGCPYLSVTRRAKNPLPRESQLIDKLIEGINKAAYKKGFCIPLETNA